MVAMNASIKCRGDESKKEKRKKLSSKGKIVVGKKEVSKREGKVKVEQLVTLISTTW